jgi:hypothetical protein
MASRLAKMGEQEHKYHPLPTIREEANHRREKRPEEQNKSSTIEK